jgi:glutamyl-tRNA synthetase
VLEAYKQVELLPRKEEWVAQARELAETLGFARDAKTYKASPDAYKGQFGDMMMILRVALTGRTNTPDLYEIQHIYGKDRVQRRLQQALAFLRQNVSGV